MRVYYLTGSQFAISNIALRRIKVSRFSDLNDPFELLAVDLSDKVHRAAFRKTKSELNQNRGLVCFSKSWRNPLVWGHYAEKHTGICLGFDVPDDMVAPVIYADRPSKIKIDAQSNEPILTEQFMNKLLCTKFSDWKYEDEVRVFVKLDDAEQESGNYFYSFSDALVLCEVILGPRCGIPIEGLKKLVTGFERPIRVIKSRIAFKRFNVVENKIASE